METWYVLEDGTYADPSDVVPGDDGVLRHKDGAAVAYGPHGPRSRGMSADDIEAARPKAKRTYKTREMKAED